MIQDYVPIEWKEDGLKWWYENSPGLYDDIYMDLTFVDIFDKYGLDAPIEKFATAFANAGYMLWHANQNARYNILNGIMPPESGHWKNNPHADDLDFQIEADYAGLMAPAMVNAATGYTDEIGHIMNYGDGWYGGVYVAAMYSMAFAHDDIETVVTEALKTIPAESKYYQCMNDVINWHKQYPDDWKQTWLECEKKWSSDLWCVRKECLSPSTSTLPSTAPTCSSDCSTARAISTRRWTFPCAADRIPTAIRQRLRVFSAQCSVTPKSRRNG